MDMNNLNDWFFYGGQFLVLLGQFLLFLKTGQVQQIYTPTQAKKTGDKKNGN